jgi:hypothetical protein
MSGIRLKGQGVREKAGPVESLPCEMQADETNGV